MSLDQDLDPTVSPAPNDQPSRQSAGDRAEAIKASVEKGLFVTVQRKSAINGRTHTGVLHEVDGEGEGKSYAVRTGQPGRPVIIAESDIHTVTVSSPPPPTAEV